MATLGFLMLFVSRLTRLRRQMAAPIAPAE
jgi:hypothetical protein